MSDETRRDGGPDVEVPEAELIEQLLDEVAAGGEIASGGEGPEGRLRREYLELFGLVGAAVDPVAPPLALRARLMAAVGGPATAGQAAVESSAAPAIPPAEAAAEAAPATAPLPSPAARGGWALPLAAALALALAAFSAYQAVQLAGQRATIEQLSGRLEDLEARTATVAELRAQLAEARQRMAMITARGVEICALRPMAAESQRANSRGVLYVAPDHQHWYLTIEDLMPCGKDRSYQLWFVPAGGEPISAGVFDVGEGSVRVELSSNTMPATTREITVTLEPAGGSPVPTGPMVLHGDEVMAVL